MLTEKPIELYFTTRLRGFFKHLIGIKSNKITFKREDSNSDGFYEIPSKTRNIARKLLNSKIGNSLGIIQVVKPKTNKGDILISYNRFLSTDKDYIIVLENPTALYHYCLEKNKTYLGKSKIKKQINNSKLKAIVCISDSCYSTLDEVLCEIPENIIKTQIYPYIPDNNINFEEIKNKCQRNDIKCLYISSNFELKSGLELINAFNKLKSLGIKNIKLEIITKVNDLDHETKEKINNLDTITLTDFNLSYDQLNRKYLDCSILLHLSRQDSFPLTVLESIKAGLTIISTNIYGIPEMVEDGKNGFLTDPKYLFFNKNNIPNESVWNNRENTIYSTYEDENITDFIFENLIKLEKDRKLLTNLCYSSLIKSKNEKFGEKSIKIKWEELAERIKLK